MASSRTQVARQAATRDAEERGPADEGLQSLLHGQSVCDREYIF